MGSLHLFVRLAYISILDATLSDNVCRWLAAGRWYSPGTPVSSNSKTDRHDIAKILLNVALNTITLTPHRHSILPIFIIIMVLWIICKLLFIRLKGKIYKKKYMYINNPQSTTIQTGDEFFFKVIKKYSLKFELLIEMYIPLNSMLIIANQW
jgi:hypothetical protein